MTPGVQADSPAPSWLLGPFAPVHDEVTLTELPVTGGLPLELDGLLLRNGPNPVKSPGPEDHWFVGDGMLHGIRLERGRARWYRNRWIRTRRFQWARGDGPEPQPGDGDSPANTHVVRHARRTLALCEVGLPWQVDGQLDTLGPLDFDGRLAGPMTAHPKVDPVTGEMVFFGYGWAPPYLRYHVADRDGTLRHSVEIAVKGPTMMHDFAVTATRTLFLDLPVIFDVTLADRTRVPYRFDPRYGARIGVLPRHGLSADVRWIEIEPCYAFHTLNAHDDGPDRVVVEMARYPSMFDWSVETGAFTESPRARLYRYTLDLTAGTARAEALDDQTCEFPRIDDRVTGRPHRYGYATETHLDPGYGHVFRHVIRYDRRSGSRVVHRVGEADVCSEPVFAAAGAGEADGYLLVVVYRAARGASDLLVLDADRLSSPPVATVELPVRIPVGFHGSWLPAPV
jgi:carotenoid cleavage dioxygenase